MLEKYEILNEEMDEKINSIATIYFSLPDEELEKVSLLDYIRLHGNDKMVEYLEKQEKHADELLKKKIIVG